MRYIYAFLFLFVSTTLTAQNTDTLPPAPINDTLGQAPDYDIDMRILDEYGFFNSINAIKLSPVFSFGKFKGSNLSFEKGGLGKKFSMNFLLGYFDGIEEYAKGIGLNGEIITDSSTLLRAAPRNFKLEIQPRFYLFENFGVYLGPSIGFHSTSKDDKPIIIAGMSSGLALKWKRLLLDSSIGIFYDTIGYGYEDFDVSMRISLNIGFLWHTKGASEQEFE